MPGAPVEPTYDCLVARPRVLVLVAASAAGVFVALLLAVAVHNGPLPLDGTVRDWVTTLTGPDGSEPTARFLDGAGPTEPPASRTRDLLRPVARLGAREVLVPLLVIGGTALSLRRRTPGPLMMLVGSYVGMALVVGPVKTLLHRPEPLDIAGQIGRSFPSGHAAQALLVYGMLAALVLAGPVAPRVRAAATVVPVVAFSAVGLAVLFRNAHWLSDMAAGYAIGLVWLAGPLALAQTAAPWLIGVPPPAGRRGPATSRLSG